MSDAEGGAAGPREPWTATGFDDLRRVALDHARTVTVADLDPQALARAVAALANSLGGEIVVGAAPGENGRLGALTGIDAARAQAALAKAIELVDPPVGHLVQQRILADAGRALLLLRVRLSPSAPHIVTTEGAVYRAGAEGVRPIRSRRALDDLYARGRGERERADRLVDAMIGRLSLQHYAFYSLAAVACTHRPSAEPYRSAIADPEWLAPPADPFVVRAGLGEIEPRVGPGEVELRTPGDVNSFIIVTRSGCVAAGEVLRRPYHEELDTTASLAQRLDLLLHTVARLLAVAGDTLMLPHAFIEGVRGLKLVLDPERRLTSGSAPQDTARHPLTAGDARDAAYVGGLAEEALDRLAALFPPRT